MVSTIFGTFLVWLYLVIGAAYVEIKFRDITAPAKFPMVVLWPLLLTVHLIHEIYINYIDKD